MAMGATKRPAVAPHHRRQTGLIDEHGGRIVPFDDSIDCPRELSFAAKNGVHLGESGGKAAAMPVETGRLRGAGSGR
jgi:hypothetical protein